MFVPSSHRLPGFAFAGHKWRIWYYRGDGFLGVRRADRIVLDWFQLHYLPPRYFAHGAAGRKTRRRTGWSRGRLGKREGQVRASRQGNRRERQEKGFGRIPGGPARRRAAL